MKMKQKMILGVVLVMLCCVVYTSIRAWNIPKEYNQSEKESKKVLHLNRLAKCADDTKIENISIADDNKELFGDKRVAYSVESEEYTKADFECIAEGLHTKIKDSEDNKEEQIYKLNNNGVLIYYAESGAITYMIDDTMKEGNINEEKCVEIARDFLNTSKIIDSEQLYLSNVEVGCTAETDEGIKVLSYQITFMKKAPKGVDGYAGVGPGICIDVDARYNITSFVSVNKNIVELSGEYDTLTLPEAENAIMGSGEVQVMTDADGEVGGTLNDVIIDDVRVCLYSDPATMEQQYMAPYYVMTGTDASGTDIEVTIPAVEEEEMVIE